MTRFNLRDGLSQELNMRVSLKLRWLIRLVFVSLVLGAVGFAGYKYMRLSEETKLTRKIVAEFKVQKYWDGNVYATFWEDCGLSFGADHSAASILDDGEGFTGKPANRPAGLIDFVWYGAEWTCPAPPPLEVGQAVYIVGWPAVSPAPAFRSGEVYLNRGVSGSPGYEAPTWIVTLDQDEPIGGGMSGGIVTDQDLNPVGVLVVQNSAFCRDLQAVCDSPEQSADIVSLHDAYHLLVK